MNHWKLELKEEAQKAMVKALLRHPHLEALVHQRLQALMDFPPSRWYRVHFHEGSATFFPESGQKVRFSGIVDLISHHILVIRFSLHE